MLPILTLGYRAGYNYDDQTLKLSQQRNRDLNSEAGHCQKFLRVVLISFLELMLTERPEILAMGLDVFSKTLKDPAMTNSQPSCDKKLAENNCPKSAIKCVSLFREK